MSLGRSVPLKPGGRLRAKPYRKAGTRAALVLLLDILCSRYVRARDGRCVICSSTYDLQCGHYWKRATHAVRWDTTNCNALCKGCNGRDNENHDPYSFALMRIYGSDEVEALRERRYSGKRFSETEMLAMAAEFKRKMKELD